MTVDPELKTACRTYVRLYCSRPLKAATTISGFRAVEETVPAAWPHEALIRK